MPVRLDPVWTREALRWVAVAAVLLSAFTARVVTSARAELIEGDRLAREGDPVAAVVHYRRAARWYAPLSPYHVEALERLARTGERAERDGDAELALSAYRAVRSGILSTRSFYTPEPTRLEAANERIADLMSAAPPPPMDANKTREALRQEHLVLLERDNAPHLGFTVMLLIGFFSWVFGAFMFAYRAVDDDDRFVLPEVRRWGVVIGLGLCLFVTGLSLA